MELLVRSVFVNRKILWSELKRYCILPCPVVLHEAVWFSHGLLDLFQFFNSLPIIRYVKVTCCIFLICIVRWSCIKWLSRRFVTYWVFLLPFHHVVHGKIDRMQSTGSNVCQCLCVSAMTTHILYYTSIMETIYTLLRYSLFFAGSASFKLYCPCWRISFGAE